MNLSLAPLECDSIPSTAHPHASVGAAVASARAHPGGGTFYPRLPQPSRCTQARGDARRSTSPKVTSSGRQPRPFLQRLSALLLIGGLTLVAVGLAARWLP